MSIMEGMVDSLQSKGCESQGMESYLLADFQLPILELTSAWENSDTPFGVLPQLDEASQRIHVHILMDTDRFRTLNDRVKDEFFQSLTLDESTFTVVINNDERADISINVFHAFVNGQPTIDQEFTAPRRDQIEITLSDVSLGLLEHDGLYLPFSLLHEAEQ